jgi:D-alanyl-lipoteichoic acid acyltransferase DltB (MBOAT superfamily)
VLFNSLDFFLFLVVFLLIYYGAPRRLQNLVLLAGSYIFYGLWDGRFLLFLAFSTLLSHACAKTIAGSREDWKRKLALAASLVGNLGVLIGCKYLDFFIESASSLLRALGFKVASPVLLIILPVGISFYTFQAIAYTLEVYRGVIRPVDSVLHYAVYMAYFPKLVAGPLERVRAFIPQISTPRAANIENIRVGLALMLLGLFKKVAIADPISPYIDPLFLKPGLFSTPELIRAVLFYTLQIYCDFSGYTDLARGASKLLGIDLSENFRFPYFANSITHFWRGWHITLSNWFRDFIFFPLERTRRQARWLSSQLNVVIVFSLTGLWHGDSVNFILWGLIHGGAIALETGVPGKWLQNVWRPLRHIYVMMVVVIAWIFFRSFGTRAALDFMAQLISLRGLELMPQTLVSILIPWAPVLLLDLVHYRAGDQLAFLRWGWVARGLMIAGMILAIVIGSGTRSPFIYAQF